MEIMKKTATVSSKHQITIPVAVRQAMGLRSGEVVIFDIDTNGETPTITLQRSPTLDEVAGSVPTPPDIAGLSWEEIRARAWVPEEARERDESIVS
jgi:antitoxin PrlF